LKSRESLSGAVRLASSVFGGDTHKFLHRNITFETDSNDLKTTSASKYGIASRRSSAPRLLSNGDLGDNVAVTNNTSPQKKAIWTKSALQRARNTKPLLASYQAFPSATTSNASCRAETSESSLVADNVNRVFDEDWNARWGSFSVTSTESSDHNPAKDGCLVDSTNYFIPVEIQIFENQVLCPQSDVDLLESW
jgi:hypothetical protein